jgi:copper(I)-binding protein
LKAVPLESGKSVEFKPGGNHVMLFDLAPTLKAGGVTELTITLDNGDKATTKAKVLGPGGAGGRRRHDMGHMDHMKPVAA